MSWVAAAAFVVTVWMLTMAIHGLRDRVAALEKRLGADETQRD